MGKSQLQNLLSAALLVAISIGFNNCTKEIKEQPPGYGSRAAQNRLATATDTRPNIIVFLANDFGYEIPTFTGGKSYSTPTLDMMAGSGIFFSHAYSHPDGSPSRVAFLTGKYSFRDYITWGHFSYDAKTFANLLSDVGYKTCFVGKWQLDDGDYGLHARGWQDYQVFLPFQGDGDGQRVGRYKNPVIYQDSAYLPDSATRGKYSEDMFSDHLCSFIDSNKGRPFLAEYSFNLVAAPYVPTPDDPDYATWNPTNEINHDDIKYFPGQVAYLDKMVNKILNKLKADGIANNTIVMFLSPTSTQSRITSVWGPNNQQIEGHKTETNTWGVHTPLTVYWPGQIRPHTDPATLVDFTDFLPTIADLAGTKVPASYGIIDGVSFADDIKGTSGPDRDWVFCHWDNDPNGNATPLTRWTNDTTYKLYDKPGYKLFYNTVKDTAEASPIPLTKMTAYERKRRQTFIKVLQSEHN